LGLERGRTFDWQKQALVHRRRNRVGFRRLLAAIVWAYELPTHPERQVLLGVDNDKVVETDDASQPRLEIPMMAVVVFRPISGEVKRHHR